MNIRVCTCTQSTLVVCIKSSVVFFACGSHIHIPLHKAFRLHINCTFNRRFSAHENVSSSKYYDAQVLRIITNDVKFKTHLVNASKKSAECRMWFFFFFRNSFFVMCVRLECTQRQQLARKNRPLKNVKIKSNHSDVVNNSERCVRW